MEKCSHCRGLGYEYHDKRVSCGGCSGSGTTIFGDTCLSCYGKGNTTRSIKQRCKVCYGSGKAPSSDSMPHIAVNYDINTGSLTNVSDKWGQKTNAFFKSQPLIIILLLVVVSTCIYSHFYLQNNSSDTIALGLSVIIGYIFIAAASLTIMHFAIGSMRMMIKLIPFAIGAFLIWLLALVFGNPTS